MTAPNPFATAPAAPQANPFASATAAAPAPVPAYPVANTQTAPVAPAAPAALAPAFEGDPFSGPAPQQPRGPRLREMYGRLLLIMPKKLEEGIPNRLGKPGDVQDRMTADVVILTGDENGQMLIRYGGKPEARVPIPHDKSAVIPHVSKAMFISSVGLISQCRDALGKRLRGEPGAMVLGRLMTGEAKGNQEPPWLLSPPTDADKAIARQYLASVDPFA